MTYTVLGGSGFIGRALVARLTSLGHNVFAPSKEMLSGDLTALKEKALGHLIYCIGLTADFRKRPLETVEAHVCLLNQLLKLDGYTSLTYLSSTRLYAGADSTDENAILRAAPGAADCLYNISKMMGESLCLNGSRRGRAVRLSNVYGICPGSENFLVSVLHEAAATGNVKLNTGPESAKDYVSLADVVRLLPDIAARGHFDIYNLASGFNTTNAQIAGCLQRSGISVEYAADGPAVKFPEINISRLSRQFGTPSNRLVDDLPNLLNEMRRFYADKNRSC
jgi:nucleoside-diphosphate-sugar epimerase